MHSPMFIGVCMVLMFTCIPVISSSLFFRVLSGEPVCYEETWIRFVYYSNSVLVYSEEDPLKSL